MEKSIKKINLSLLFNVIKGSLISLIISLVLILSFSFVIKYIAIPTNFIRPVNQIIKIISIFFGVFFVIKRTKKNGFINGLLIGFVYTIIAFLSFSILDHNFEFNLSLLNDLLFGGCIGIICGVISSNILN